MVSDSVVWIDDCTGVDWERFAPLLLKIRERLRNHEVWRVCANCGAWIDARNSLTCSECGFKNDL